MRHRRCHARSINAPLICHLPPHRFRPRRRCPLVGPSVGRSVGRVIGRSAGRSLARAVGRSVRYSVAWLLGRSVGLSVGRAVVRSLGRSAWLHLWRPASNSSHPSEGSSTLNLPKKGAVLAAKESCLCELCVAKEASKQQVHSLNVNLGYQTHCKGASAPKEPFRALD